MEIKFYMKYKETSNMVKRSGSQTAKYASQLVKSKQPNIKAGLLAL